MTKTQSRCDEEQLKVMLRTEGSSAGRDAIISHLESCSHCQTRLAEMAADEDDWQKVAGVLSSRSEADESLEFELQETLLPRLERLRGLAESWLEQRLRQLLDPPSHPAMPGRLGRYEVERLIGSGGMGKLPAKVAIHHTAPKIRDDAFDDAFVWHATLPTNEFSLTMPEGFQEGVISESSRPSTDRLKEKIEFKELFQGRVPSKIL